MTATILSGTVLSVPFARAESNGASQRGETRDQVYAIGAGTYGAAWALRENYKREKVGTALYQAEAPHGLARFWNREMDRFVESSREEPLAASNVEYVQIHKPNHVIADARFLGLKYNTIPNDRVLRAIEDLRSKYPADKVMKVRVAMQNSLYHPDFKLLIEGTPSEIAKQLADINKTHQFISIGRVFENADEIKAADARTRESLKYRLMKDCRERSFADGKAILNGAKLLRSSIERKILMGIAAVGAAAYAGPLVLDKAETYVNERSIKKAAEEIGSDSAELSTAAPASAAKAL
ncbi:MAG: hypothetical protein NDJ89_02085 [Oligoflexia bacterium]|nr:hypothetical protein [Oligoflexia bacterium]